MRVEIGKGTVSVPMEGNEECGEVDGEGRGVGVILGKRDESEAGEDVLELECDRLGE